MQITPVAAGAFSFQSHGRPTALVIRPAVVARRREAAPTVAADRSAVRRGYLIDIIC